MTRTPFYMLRKTRHLTRVALCALSLWCVACGDVDDGGEMATGGSGGTDSLGEGAGGASDPINAPGQPVDIDGYFANPDRSITDGLDAEAPTVQERGEFAAYEEAVTACFDPPSADAECAAAACSAVAACCVGNATCCTEVVSPAIPKTLDFASCDTAPVDCVDGNAMAFGPTEPAATPSGLVAGGDFSADAGLIIGGVVDLGTHRVVLDIDYREPVDCGAGCLETAGVGFVPEGLPVTETVRPDVGILFAPAQDQVSLLVGGAVVTSAPLRGGQGPWTFELTPTGSVTLERNGLVQATAEIDTTEIRNANLVLYGRNEGARAPGAIATVQTSIALCDIPTSWNGRNLVNLIDGGSSPSPIQGRAPSVATNETETRIVWEQNGEFWWGRSAGTPATFELLGTVFEVGNGLGTLRDPELVWDGATWHLFYTIENMEEPTGIGHAVFDGQRFVADSGLVLDASPQSLEQPSVYQRDGLWVLAARAIPDGQPARVQIYATAALGTGWEAIDSPDLVAGTLAMSTDGSVGDIGDPSLIVHDSAYQLYFGRRQGTRWRIELLASDDLVFWRSLGTVFEGSDDSAAFDAFGASTPDAISVGDQIELFYTAHDGVRDRLGFTVRDASGDSALAP